MGSIRPISTEAIGAICEIYGLTITEFERISLIENHLYEWLVEKSKAESEAKHGRSTNTGGNHRSPEEPGQVRKGLQRRRYRKH
jgi:hypothetical protein